MYVYMSIYMSLSPLKREKRGRHNDNYIAASWKQISMFARCRITSISSFLIHRPSPGFKLHNSAVAYLVKKNHRSGCPTDANN